MLCSISRSSFSVFKGSGLTSNASSNPKLPSAKCVSKFGKSSMFSHAHKSSSSVSSFIYTKKKNSDIELQTSLQLKKILSFYEKRTAPESNPASMRTSHKCFGSMRLFSEICSNIDCTLRHLSSNCTKVSRNSRHSTHSFSCSA